MQDRQTKTIVQVCKGADQIEKAPGPSKTHLLLGGVGATCMGEEKKREIL
jgi:hypothetical protein